VYACGDWAVTDWCVFVMIEIVGKHTDYAKGSSLVCAVEKGIAFTFLPRSDNLLKIASCDYNATPLTFDLADWENSVKLEANKKGWGVYVASVIEYLMLKEYKLTGVSIGLKSNLPQNSGLSSSSALVCGVATILTREHNTGDDHILHVDELGKIESGNLVGTRGGSQDHAAIMKSKKGKLSLFSYEDGTKMVKQIDMPSELVFVVGVSGVSACKTGNALEKYNRLATSSDKEKHARAKKETETAVHLTCQGFDNNDHEDLAKGVKLSQDHAETELQTTVPETAFLPSSALSLGAIGSTTFGAGFGGACYALVEKSKSEQFIQDWKRAYVSKFPDAGSRASFFFANPSRGAYFLNV